MIPVDLITGYLGAGKTTFILHYAAHLLSRGEKLGILVYDHGAVNVDLPLLSSLRSERCELETLASTCDPDCHRRRFRTRLISMAMSGYDRILIEPSGVFDMDEFYDTLREEPLDRWLEIGSVICVADAKLPEDTLPEEDFFLASQAACAGMVVLSRVQQASGEEIARTLCHLDRALTAIRSVPLRRERVLARDWETLTETDYAALDGCAYQLPDYVKTIPYGESGFQSLSFLRPEMSRDELEEKVKRLFSEADFGRVLRVKGFFRDGETDWQLNATEKETRLVKTGENPGVITVIGRDLQEDAITRLLTGKAPTLHIL